MAAVLMALGLAALMLPNAAGAWTGQATISGRVVDQSGAPVQTCVQAQNSSYQSVFALPNPDGQYSLTVGSPDSWRILFGCYGDQWIKMYWGGQTNPNLAKVVTVADGDAVTGIDITLVKGAVVTGHVTDANGQPEANSYVSLQSSTGFGAYASGQSDSSGAYTIRGVVPGSYIASASSPDGQAWWHGTSFNDAGHFLAAAGRSTTIDIAFTVGNSISGRVTDTAGNPLNNECVIAEAGPDGYGYTGFAYTDTSGNYVMKSLPDGSYTVVFNTCADLGHLTRYFDGATDQAGATRISVSGGQAATGVDAVLGAGGGISGTVVGEDGTPIGGACVSYARAAGFAWDYTTVTADTAGRYRLPRVNDADYYVHAGCAPDPYLGRWYGATTPGDLTTAGATVIHGTSTSEISGIDFTLLKGGAVEGTITSNGQPVQGACVMASGTDAAPYALGSTVTDASGHYRLSALAGDSDLAITPLCSYGAYPDLVPEWYHDGLIKSQATPVSVTLGQTTLGVDEDLPVGGQITGTITDSTGQPAVSVCATAVLDNFDVPQFGDVIYGNRVGSSDGQGHFTIHALPPGSYHVGFADCSNGNRFSQATIGPLNVTGGQTTAGADVVMAPQPPTALGLVPTAAAAGESISLVGTGLGAVNEVDFGGSPSPSVTHATDYQVDAVVPAGVAGSTVDVTAAAPGWTSGAFPFTYISPAPVVGGLSPDHGPAAGGTSVTITGSNFTGATSVQFGGVDAASFTVVDDATITATTPAGSGTAPVVVSRPDLASTGGPSFTFVAPPTVDYLSPSSGPESGGTWVFIQGSNLDGATAVKFGGVDAAGFTMLNGGIAATSPAGTGSVPVTVTTPSGTSTGGPTFEYVPPKPPEVVTVSPSAGPVGGGTTVTIQGAHLADADGVSFGAAPAAGFGVIDDQTLWAVSPAAPGAGTVDVTVHGPGGTSLVAPGDAFTYRAAPVVSGLSPNSGPRAGGTAVTITGGDFTGATNVAFGTSSASFHVVSAQEITAIAPAGSGPVNVSVSTPGGVSAASTASAYTYRNPPLVTGVSPSRGAAAGGSIVTITGQNLGGASSVLIGGVSASFTVYDGGTISAVTPPHARGIVDVSVTTVDGTSTATGAYRYVGAPQVTSVTPSSGSKAGGTVVRLAGVDLVDVTSVVLVDRNAGDKKRTAVTFTELADGTVTFTTPVHKPGTVGIELTTRYGTSPSSAASYSFKN